MYLCMSFDISLAWTKTGTNFAFFPTIDKDFTFFYLVSPFFFK